ncbi:MAG TPA: aminodeoxychorismate synthase component I, partial [Pyrinomonadaceae bacterium]|nr:aminodeoxychorismate synthase component I [Pyrinomonadaceae bacterium]
MGNNSASPLLIFDFRNRDGTARPLCFAEPVEVVVAGSLAEVRPALRRVQACVNAGLYAAGYVSYEAAPAFDSAFDVRDGAQLPLLWFGIFRAPSTRETFLTDGDFRFDGWLPATRRDEYDQNVGRVRAAIARGQTYQVNYTLRLVSRFEGDALACYRRLQALQRPPYAAYLDTGRQQILSASPELFFRLRGGEITTRPMKGTIRRGRWTEEDDALAAQLAASEKDRAENVMIVDLLRNDLGRIADVGSVRVASLFDIERYPSVHQLTSTVTAGVPRDITLEDIFAALFPCGSITGAPKVSTMRLIAALEDSPREIYCGAIGFVTPEREAVFNVAIRTMTIDGATGEAAYGVGGGITWDSNADDEYREALVKAAQLLEDWSDFELLETLRLERGAYFLPELHLR